MNEKQPILIPSLLSGKLAVLSEFGIELEREYENILSVGSYYTARQIFYRNHMDKYATKLMFANKSPVRKDGVVLYCLKEVGRCTNDDWYWFSLDQLIVIENEIKLD